MLSTAVQANISPVNYIFLALSALWKQLNSGVGESSKPTARLCLLSERGPKCLTSILLLESNQPGRMYQRVRHAPNTTRKLHAF